MYIPVLQTLPIKILFNYKRFSLDALLGNNAFAFRYGRDAILWGLKSLNIKRGDNVLIPCSVCEAVLLPFLSLGINIKYYILDSELNYEIKDIESKIDEHTRAVYLVHYFGFPQKINPLIMLCKKMNLFLIEDCAHSMHTIYHGKELGAYGDISIFSLRKFLPIPDGGCLKINYPDYFSPDIRLKKQHIKPAFNLIKLILNDLGIKCIIPIRFIKKIWNYFKFQDSDYLKDDYSGNEDCTDFNFNISYFSRFIINKINIEDIFSKRRENYLFWLENIGSLPGFVPLFPDLPDDVVPYCFPSLVNNRDELQAKFERTGLFFEPTLNFPHYNYKYLMDKNESFPVIESVADRFLSLPVHQSLNVELLEKVRKKIIKIL